MEKYRVLKRAFGKWYENIKKSASRGFGYGKIQSKSASRGFGYGKMQSFEGLAHQVLARHKEIVRTDHSRYLDM